MLPVSMQDIRPFWSSVNTKKEALLKKLAPASSQSISGIITTFPFAGLLTGKYFLFTDSRSEGLLPMLYKTFFIHDKANQSSIRNHFA